jgi:hypothetical protein
VLKVYEKTWPRFTPQLLCSIVGVRPNMWGRQEIPGVEAAYQGPVWKTCTTDHLIFMYPSIFSFIHAVTHLLTDSLARSLARFPANPPGYPAGSITGSFTHSLTYARTHALNQLLTHRCCMLTYLLRCSLVCSLAVILTHLQSIRPATVLPHFVVY